MAADDVAARCAAGRRVRARVEILGADTRARHQRAAPRAFKPHSPLCSARTSSPARTPGTTVIKFIDAGGARTTYCARQYSFHAALRPWAPESRLSIDRFLATRFLPCASLRRAPRRRARRRGSESPGASSVMPMLAVWQSCLSPSCSLEAVRRQVGQRLSLHLVDLGSFRMMANSSPPCGRPGPTGAPLCRATARCTTRGRRGWPLIVDAFEVVVSTIASDNGTPVSIDAATVFRSARSERPGWPRA